MFSCIRKKKRKQPLCVYEQIERQQRQAGIRDFMVRRGYDWSPGTSGDNNRRSSRDGITPKYGKSTPPIPGLVKNPI